MSTKKRNLLIRLLGVLLGVLVAMIALVAMGMIYMGLSRPYYNPHGYRNACIANLKQIHGATASWAQENKKTNSDTLTTTDLYGREAYIREEPKCPQGGNYVIGSVQQKPCCSISGHTL